MLSSCERAWKERRIHGCSSPNSMYSGPGSFANVNKKRTSEAGLTALLGIFLLVATMKTYPYGFYMVLRLVATVGSAWWVARLYKEELLSYAWLFAGLALLMNPFIPIRMTRRDWQGVDLVSGVSVLIWATYWYFHNFAKNTESSQTFNTKDHLPDLGKHLAGKGTPQKTLLVYPTWRMDTLAIMGKGRYCVTLTQTVEGKAFCATFDFGSEVLQKILSKSPASTRVWLERKLEENPGSIRHEAMPNPICIGITATLGNLQESLSGSFIPLIIREVFDDKGPPRDEESFPVGHEANAQITAAEILAIKLYCRHLAKRWWEPIRKMSAVCDNCNKPIFRDGGFMNDSNLICHSCFEPNSAPDAALANLKDDPEYYGATLLDEARLYLERQGKN